MLAPPYAVKNKSPAVIFPRGLKFITYTLKALFATEITLASTKAKVIIIFRRECMFHIFNAFFL